MLTIKPDGDYLFNTCKYTDEVIAISLKNEIITINLSGAKDIVFKIGFCNITGLVQ